MTGHGTSYAGDNPNLFTLMADTMRWRIVIKNTSLWLCSKNKLERIKQARVNTVMTKYDDLLYFIDTV